MRTDFSFVVTIPGQVLAEMTNAGFTALGGGKPAKINTYSANMANPKEANLRQSTAGLHKALNSFASSFEDAVAKNSYSVIVYTDGRNYKFSVYYANQYDYSGNYGEDILLPGYDNPTRYEDSLMRLGPSKAKDIITYAFPDVKFDNDIFD